jgi:hypothetical protein
MDHREIKKQALASILKTTILVGDFENRHIGGRF